VQKDTRIIVTRAQGQAASWIDALQAAGLAAVALPLIDIAGVDARDALTSIARDVTRWHAVMFVSASAVHHFFDETPVNVWKDVTCWVTGPGTQKALQARGIAAHNIVAPPQNEGRFDSEALWEQVQAWPSTSVGFGSEILLVRGRDQSDTHSDGSGRDWLSDQVLLEGGKVTRVVVYERRLPVWDASQMRVAQEAVHTSSVWLINSSQALRNLRALLPQMDPANVVCWVTHPRIAAHAQSLGFTTVIEIGATLPALLVACRHAVMT
jgi:uroporphyrinogen-III synthase